MTIKKIQQGTVSGAEPWIQGSSILDECLNHKATDPGFILHPLPTLLPTLAAQWLQQEGCQGLTPSHTGSPVIRAFSWEMEVGAPFGRGVLRTWVPHFPGESSNCCAIIWQCQSDVVAVVIQEWCEKQGFWQGWDFLLDQLYSLDAVRQAFKYNALFFRSQLCNKRDCPANILASCMQLWGYHPQWPPCESTYLQLCFLRGQSCIYKLSLL